MATQKLLLLPGDGIGVEVMAEVEAPRRLSATNGRSPASRSRRTSSAAPPTTPMASAISDAAMAKAQAADAVHVRRRRRTANGTSVPYDVRPEAGLLRLRKDLGLFANLRPAICYPALADASSLKRELVEGLDIMIVRELTGGVYFGEPKEIVTLENGEKRAVDTQVYTTHEIERIARVAFDLAQARATRSRRPKSATS